MAYNELIGKIDEHSLLDKVLEKVKEIVGIEKFNNTKMFSDANDWLPADITFKNAAILMTCFTKNHGLLYR